MVSMLRNKEAIAIECLEMQQVTRDWTKRDYGMGERWSASHRIVWGRHDAVGKSGLEEYNEDVIMSCLFRGRG
jgi:hypothetical protein